MVETSRRRVGRWARTGLVAVATVAMSAGCSAFANGAGPTGADTELPGTVRHVASTNTDQVVLTAPAAKRLGITTEPVRDAQVAGATRKVIPYGAILYDASGEPWTYTNPEPLVYVRERITVESIQGDRAILSDGPASGTAVVVIGATELYGTEFGVSGDE